MNQIDDHTFLPEEWLKKAKLLADNYAHVYSFVGDDSMLRSRDELFKHLSLAIKQNEPEQCQHIELKALYWKDFKTCVELDNLKPEQLWQWQHNKDDTDNWHECKEVDWTKDIYRRHPHADSIVAYHKCSNADKQRWQFSYDDGETWGKCMGNFQWSDDFIYRLKPKVITLNGKEFNAPMRVAPKIGTTYYYISNRFKTIVTTVWNDTDVDYLRLTTNISFLVKEDAEGVLDEIKNSLTD